MSCLKKQMKKVANLLYVRNPLPVWGVTGSNISFLKTGKFTLSWWEIKNGQVRKTKRMIQYLAWRIQNRESGMRRIEDSVTRTSAWAIQDPRHVWGLNLIWGAHYEDPDMRSLIWGAGQHEETEKQYLQWALLWPVWSECDCEEYPLLWGRGTSPCQGHLHCCQCFYQYLCTEDWLYSISMFISFK